MDAAQVLIYVFFILIAVLALGRRKINDPHTYNLPRISFSKMA